MVNFWFSILDRNLIFKTRHHDWLRIHFGLHKMQSGLCNLHNMAHNGLHLWSGLDTRTSLPPKVIWPRLIFTLVFIGPANSFSYSSGKDLKAQRLQSVPMIKVIEPRSESPNWWATTTIQIWMKTHLFFPAFVVRSRSQHIGEQNVWICNLLFPHFLPCCSTLHGKVLFGFNNPKFSANVAFADSLVWKWIQSPG